MNIIKALWLDYKLASLILKINKRGGLHIGGYKNSMIKFIRHDYGKMWLHEKDWEYIQIQKMWDDGELVKCGEQCITSPHTGITYTDPIYNHVSNMEA